MNYFLCLCLCMSLVMTQSLSKCPSYGRLNYTCSTNDYCNEAMGLVCGYGYCGTNCPLGWTAYNDSCYYTNNNQISFSDAVNVCQSLNSTLLTAKTKNDINAIRSVLSIPSSDFIWLTAVAVDYLTFQWPDGTKLMFNDSMWDVGEPNDDTTKEECLFMKPTGVHDVTCNAGEIARFICELKKVCEKSQCNCAKNAYYNSTLDKCVNYKTFGECCSSDQECNPNQALLCIDGECLCDDHRIKWDVLANKCLRCGRTKRVYDDHCYIIDIRGRSFSQSVTFCAQKSAKLFELHHNVSILTDLVSPYRTIFAGNGIWINATEYIMKNEDRQVIYCGGASLKNITAGNCIFVDLFNTAHPFCLFNAPCSAFYGSLCKEN